MTEDYLKFMKRTAERIANRFGHDLGDWEEVGVESARAICQTCGDAVTVYASGASSGKAVQQYCKAGQE